METVGPSEPTPVNAGMLWSTRSNSDGESSPPAPEMTLEPHERNCYPGVPIMQSGPPFNLAQIVLCTPHNERRQVALILEATPPTYKVLLENGRQLDTARDRADIFPDWNHDHPEFAPRRTPEPFVEERRALLRKRECTEDIDIHRRAKRRRVAFAEEPAAVLFQLENEQIKPVIQANNFTLPPAQKDPHLTPPPKPPPKSWTSDPILTSLFPHDTKERWHGETGSHQDTATTMDMDAETMTTAAEMADDMSDWSVDSEDENDDEGKPTSLMQPQHLAEVHPFVEVLHKWKEGIEVDCGDDWEWATIEEAVLRGPHPTANTPES